MSTAPPNSSAKPREPTGQGRGTLAERLAAGPLVVAEGYLFELERRGYLKAGAFVPEVVLAHPEKVRELHREFVHAGSDVVEALTYYGHREKLRVIGAEHLLEPLNRTALEIAREVADESGTLLAGNVCNTNLWGSSANDVAAVREIFTEQVRWAAEAGVDYVIGETFAHVAEAELASRIIQDHGLDAVITLALHKAPTFQSGVSVEDAARRIEDTGARVVGLNCHRGPETMLGPVARMRAVVDIDIAALPVPYRTTPEAPTFQSLDDPRQTVTPNGRAFPTGLDPFTCTRYELADFGRAALAAGVSYLGICCGAAPHHVRALAESVGRNPAAARYSADMQQHALFGNYPGIRTENQALATEM